MTIIYAILDALIIAVASYGMSVLVLDQQRITRPLGRKIRRFMRTVARVEATKQRWVESWPTFVK